MIASFLSIFFPVLKKNRTTLEIASKKTMSNNRTALTNKGAMSAPIPGVNNKSRVLLPIRFPTAREPALCLIADTDVIISGKLVPTPIINIPISDCSIPKF